MAINAPFILGSGSHDLDDAVFGEEFHMSLVHETARAELNARRQAVLHDKLKLTGSQEAAWKTYIAAATPPAPPARPERGAWEKMSAPERMEKMMSMMKEREGHMTTHLAAMKTFYATLSPLQQQIFNDNVGAGMGHRGHGRG